MKRAAKRLSTLYNLGVTLNISIDYLLGVATEKKSIFSQIHTAERDLAIERIIKKFNGYGFRELLISNII